MMSISIITSIGITSGCAYVLGKKAVWDKIEKAFNFIFGPSQIKRIAKAEAEAKAETALIEAKNKEDIIDYQTACQRIREQNIINAITKAVGNTTDNQIAPEPLDPDWFLRWLDIVGDFTQEYVNDLWAKILEREMKQPNAVSLRTMDILKNMTKSEGEAFVRICKYVVSLGETLSILVIDCSIWESDDNKAWNDFFTSREAGLINLQSDLQFTFKLQPPEESTLLLEYQNKRAVIKVPDNIKEIPVNIFPLTQAGKELFPIANIGQEDSQYFQSIIDFFTTDYNGEVKISNIE